MNNFDKLINILQESYDKLSDKYQIVDDKIRTYNNEKSNREADKDRLIILLNQYKYLSEIIDTHHKTKIKFIIEILVSILVAIIIFISSCYIGKQPVYLPVLTYLVSWIILYSVCSEIDSYGTVSKLKTYRKIEKEGTKEEIKEKTLQLQLEYDEVIKALDELNKNDIIELIKERKRLDTEMSIYRAKIIDVERSKKYALNNVVNNYNLDDEVNIEFNKDSSLKRILRREGK